MPSPRNPELFKVVSPEKPETRAADLVNSRVRNTKRRRQLPYATRFEYWRTTEGLSLGKIAARLEDKTREFGMEAPYLLTRLMELENGRHKPPTWLMFLLVETYGVKFPWWEFVENVKEAR